MSPLICTERPFLVRHPQQTLLGSARSFASFPRLGKLSAMPWSFHSHSGQFCCHAHGQLEDMVQAAIAKRFTHLGLSEHMPRFRLQDMYPDEPGLTPADLERIFADYVAEARRLQRKYADQIEILVGGETDMCRPEWLEDVKRVAAQHDLEYLVGSVHHVRQMPIDYDEPSFVVAEKACGGTEAIFIAYFEQVAEMVAQLRPSIVGHFDLIRLFRQQQPLSPPIWAAIDKAIAAIVKHDCLVEINSSGLRKKLMAPYPHGDILKVMLDRGVKLILADDSHRTEQVAVCYAQVREYLQQHGVQEVYRLRRASDAAPGMAGTTVEAVKLESILDHPAWA